MSLENIIDRILKDSDKKAQLLKKEASSKAEDILNKAKEESDILRKKILNEANQQAQQEKEKAYVSKELEIKKELLKKKRELIDAAFDGAYKFFLKLDTKKYLEILEKILIAQIKDKKEKYEIQFFKTDATKTNEDFITSLNKKGFNLKLGPYIEKEGLGLTLKKDKLIMDFSFLKGLNALKHILQSEAAGILFG